MPHFVIHCSENLIQNNSPETILKAVYEQAESTNLFTKGDIKVRILPFKWHITGEGEDDFVHVFANIMEGRTENQKKDLSHKVVKKLKELFPNIPIISMNIRDFESSTYMNKAMV